MRTALRPSLLEVQRGDLAAAASARLCLRPARGAPPPQQTGLSKFSCLPQFHSWAPNLIPLTASSFQVRYCWRLN